MGIDCHKVRPPECNNCIFPGKDDPERGLVKIHTGVEASLAEIIACLPYAAMYQAANKGEVRWEKIIEATRCPNLGCEVKTEGLEPQVPTS